MIKYGWGDPVHLSPKRIYDRFVKIELHNKKEVYFITEKDSQLMLWTIPVFNNLELDHGPILIGSRENLFT